MDVLSRGKVHCSVRPPADGPCHLLDFFLNGRTDHRVADVGVDFDQKLPAYDHGLAFGMVYVGGDYRTAPCRFASDILGIDIFPQRHKLHLRRNNSLPRVVHLCDVSAAPQDRTAVGQWSIRIAMPGYGPIAWLHPIVLATFQNPGQPQGRETLAEIQVHLRVGIWTRCVVHAYGRVQLNLAVHFPGWLHRDLAHRDTDSARSMNVNFFRGG